MKIEIAFSKTEGSAIYPTWKIISFMDAARRRETRVRYKGKFVSHSNSSSHISTFVPVP